MKRTDDNTNIKTNKNKHTNAIKKKNKKSKPTNKTDNKNQKNKTR